MADTFVKMTKDGETIKVNALCVDDHKRLGWKELVEPEKAAKPEKPPKDKEPEKAADKK